MPAAEVIGPHAEASWRRSKDWSGRTENKTADTGDRAGSGAADHQPFPLSFSAMQRGIIGGGMGSQASPAQQLSEFLGELNCPETLDGSSVNQRLTVDRRNRSRT